LPNFAFVQNTPCTGAQSQTFPDDVGEGNCIIVFIFVGTGVVSDNQGNTYVPLQHNWNGNNNAAFAATKVAGGPTTVSCTGTGAILALEYSSENPNYYVCPGGAQNEQVNAALISNNVFFQTGPPDPYVYTSAEEVMAVFLAWQDGTIGNFTIPADQGTIQINATIPQDLVTVCCAGDSNVASMPGAFTAGPILSSVPANPSQNLCVFLNLTGGCPDQNNPSIFCASPPAGNVGVPYSHTFIWVGGDPPFTWSIISGSLPPGLTLDPVAGVVSGTPTMAGAFPFTVGVTDSLGNTGSVSCSITIAASSVPAISCNNPPGAGVGTPYSHLFTVTGGTAPFSYSIISGSLPNGLSLSSGSGGGLVSGTPTTAGTFPFTIQVTDSGAQTASVGCSISVTGVPTNFGSGPATGVGGGCSTPERVKRMQQLQSFVRQMGPVTERHQDYTLIIPTIPPGESAIQIPLQLDLDAPFLLRGRGIRVTPPSTSRTQSQILTTRFRYTNAAGDYLAQQAVNTPQDFWGAYGQGGNYRPVWPQQPYPPGGVISVDVYNDGAATMNNVQVIFRGVKLFRKGSISAPTYPSPCLAREFTYQTGKGSPTDGQIVLTTTETLRQLPLTILADADFVLRAGQAGCWTSSGDDGGTYSDFGYTELYVQLFDSDLKPYSNIPIHIDWLLGNAGTGLASFTALGSAAPGVLFPEIYLPKSTEMYFDLIRNDAAYVAITDALPVRLSMAWIGSKIFS
jgi:Putative Ig domain